jgi:hypothetical protein
MFLLSLLALCYTIVVSSAHIKNVPRAFGDAFSAITLLSPPELQIAGGDIISQNTITTLSTRAHDASPPTRSALHVDEKLVPRAPAPAYRGTMMMDCKKAREACTNACWYQNCVLDPSTPAVYTFGGDNADDANENRIDSGAKVTGQGTPCKLWPYGQLFTDTFPFVSSLTYKRFVIDTI